MKTKALKSLMLVAAAIVLVVASVLGTMAYLTSTAAVSNTFSVGNVKLHMYESKVTEDGLRIDADNIATDADGNHYRLDTQTGKYVLDTTIQDSQVTKLKKEASSNNYLLVPGEKYVKDPTITVDAGSVPSYLFVRVRNDIKTIEKNNVPAQTPADGETEGSEATEPTVTEEPSKTPSIVEQLRANGWLEIERAASGVDAVFV